MRIRCFRSCASVLSILVLSACSGAEPSATGDTEGKVVVAPPDATTTGSGMLGNAAAFAPPLAASAAPSDFADFDFANGTRYPEQATASIGPAFYRPGSSIAYVPISLDRPTPNTAIARVMTEAVSYTHLTLPTTERV